MEASSQYPTNADVVLIHGLWMTPKSWEKWQQRYEDRGFNVIAPSWPGLEGREPEELRRDPSPLADIDADKVLDHYERIIRAQERPPILMGHSFGGAFMQVLLDRGLGSAGVGIDAATTKGVLKLPLSSLRSAFPVLRNPRNNHKAVPQTKEQFHYTFGNLLSEEESNAVYERYNVPAAATLLFESATANFHRHSPFEVDYGKERAPLLFIAGGEDHVVPAAANRANLKHYKHSKSVVDYKEFPGRSHYTVGQEGWEEVADYALDWAVQHSGVRAAA
jgi:pimeloyl-ACP methyl ester carboxylesterase